MEEPHGFCLRVGPSQHTLYWELFQWRWWHSDRAASSVCCFVAPDAQKGSACFPLSELLQRDRVKVQRFLMRHESGLTDWGKCLNSNLSSPAGGEAMWFPSEQQPPPQLCSCFTPNAPPRFVHTARKSENLLLAGWTKLREGRVTVVSIIKAILTLLDWRVAKIILWLTSKVWGLDWLMDDENNHKK